MSGMMFIRTIAGQFKASGCVREVGALRSLIIFGTSPGCKAGVSDLQVELYHVRKANN